MLNAPATSASSYVIPSNKTSYSDPLVDDMLNRAREKSVNQFLMRRTGEYLESVNDIMANPKLLENKSLLEVKSLVGNSDGWVNDVMRRSSRAEGWMLRELNSRGSDFSGRMLQYHPGTPRHFGGNPYWKVSNGINGTIRIEIKK